VRDFEVAVSQDGSEAVVQVMGELDVYTSPRLREELLRLISEDVRSVTLDLAGTIFIDSTGLGVLVAGLKRLREHDGDLKLKSPNAGVMKVLAITGLTRVFEIG
jgi:anti-sigma B factor antagonist